MSIIEGLNKEFNHKNRVGIMAILVVNDWVDFNTLKELLDIPDGTLASHLKALESVNISEDDSSTHTTQYIESKKEFVGKKPRTSYRCTQEGRVAFTNHLNALEDLLKMATMKN